MAAATVGALGAGGVRREAGGEEGSEGWKGLCGVRGRGFKG